MIGTTMGSLVMVALLAALAPLLMASLSRLIKIPLVVYEIALGLLFGPAILNVFSSNDFIDALSDLGLAMLFFLAGNEIDYQRIRGRPLNRSLIGWLVSLAGGLIVGVIIAPSAAAIIFVAVALTSTALGTLMPILRDAGELRTPFGIAVIAIGAVGEFGPLIAISLFLSGHRVGVSTVILLIFVAVAAGAILLAARGKHTGMHRLINATLHTSGQFAVRLVILLIFALVGLSVLLDLDMLLGAFVAGVVAKLLLADATPADRRMVEAKLDAVGFGFLVPIFFIETGLTFDLNALTSDPMSLLLVPALLLALLVVRGLPGLFSAPPGANWADRRAIALFSGTGLPIIVAVTQIGTDSGDLPVALASALVGAGMLSVLMFPLIALSQRRPSPAPPSREIITERELDDG